ncbi:MAG: YfiH family protein [Cellvibrionaceae bacterium]
MINLQWLDWPAPPNVRAAFSLRRGGHSESPFNDFNLAQHVGDRASVVIANRQQLSNLIGDLPIAWLNQVHGKRVVVADPATLAEADASFTKDSERVCCVMTADCLPVFFCDNYGHQVAIAHAGWRGLASGVLQVTLAEFPTPENVKVYFGPAISVRALEVGEEVRQSFLTIPGVEQSVIEKNFHPAELPGKWMADLYSLARYLLQLCGVTQFYGGDRCTYSESDDFFSYRRDGKTGRMANLIWIERS